MIWLLFMNQGVAVLDQTIYEDLCSYLHGKESQLSHQISEVSLLLASTPTLSRAQSAAPMRLSEAVEEFSRKINKTSHASANKFSAVKWENLASQINDDLWAYVEVLEGCVTELFQQINRISFEQWNHDLVDIATKIKDELTKRMDDLVWAILRLENQLEKYRWMSEARSGKWVAWRKIVFSWQWLLDRSLRGNVFRCHKFLGFRFQQFIERYTGYLQLFESVQESQQKYHQFRVLSSMDLDQQDRLKHLCFLLELWKKNKKSRVLSRNEVLRALRGCSSYDVLYGIFKEYIFAIRKALFDKSRMIKKQFRVLFIDVKIREPFFNNISVYRNELKMLYETILQYKKFHFDTDPPKKTLVQKLFRWASNKQEANHLRDLNHLLHEIQSLDLLALNFRASMESESFNERKITPELKKEINRYLHEMAQPLASRDLMYRDGLALVGALQGLDEMGAFDPNVVHYIRHTLIRAMCVDWKYHVLQEIPLFHHVYEVHQNICAIDENRQHMNRLHKFQRVLDQLAIWIENNETLKRAHEIELDINNLKAYLQDFFAYVQNLEVSKSESQENELNNLVIQASQALLKYLYVFGQFFQRLHNDNSEQRMVRKQLLFVDQYFEEIEIKIYDLLTKDTPLRS